MLSSPCVLVSMVPSVVLTPAWRIAQRLARFLARPLRSCTGGEEGEESSTPVFRPLRLWGAGWVVIPTPIAR